MKARGRPWSWITGRPRLTDGLIVAFNLLAGALALFGSAFRVSLLPIFVSAALIQALALWWRRTYPVVVLAAVVLSGLVWFLAVPEREPSSPALAFAVYAVSVYDRTSIRLWVAGAAIAVILAAVGLLLLGDIQAARGLIPAAATSLVGWVIGDYIRSRRQFLADLVARHQHEREQAAEAERVRLARELHDVVAHNVSAMAIQAGAARVSGNATEETLKSIEQSARDTLAELNRLLGVLRKSPGSPALAPQPMLVDVDTILKPARDAGLEATLRITGEQRQLPAALDLSAYRIVQEALTNVLKHAGASRVEVTVDYRPDAIALTISDNGNGATSTPSTGHGLIGMRERVTLLGGEFSARPLPGYGFQVSAHIPLPSGAAA